MYLKFIQCQPQLLAMRQPQNYWINLWFMQESEILKVQAGDANELHVIASIMEVKPREVTT